MSRFKQLVALERGSLRGAFPGLRGKSLLRSFFFGATFLTAGLALLPPNESMPYIMYPYAVLLLMSFATLLGILTIIGAPGKPFYYWWLLLPHSRFKLVAAKALVSALLIGSIAVVAILACAAHYVISAAALGLELRIASLLSLSAAYLLLALACIPVLIVMGFLICIFYSKKLVIGLIPYIIFLQAPSALLGFISQEQQALPYLSPAHLTVYALVVIVVGWSLSYWLLRVIAKTGMRNLADARLFHSNGAAAGKQPSKSTTVQRDDTGTSASRATSGRRAIYRLERSRYRHYGSHPFVRGARYLIYAAVAIGAYFVSGHPGAGFQLLQVLYLAPVIGASIMMLVGATSSRSFLGWWLAFPYRRFTLASVRLYAVWAATGRVMASLTVCFLLGATAAETTGFALDGEVVGYLPWLVYCLAIHGAVLVFATSLAQAASEVPQGRFSTLLSGLFGLYIALQSTYISRFLYPEQYDSAGLMPNWPLAAIMAAIGLLSAWGIIALTARYLHIPRQMESLKQG